jgi:thiamine biosynthesis lipoprotein
MIRAYSRRRAIAIFAAAAGMPLLAHGTPSTSSVTWSGHALGAPATLILNHPDRAVADRMVLAVVAEVKRLEGIFSLYRDDSALSELNRIGALAAPPRELVDLLGSCHDFWRISGGAFDPTIQPLWALYRDHFSRPDAAPFGPPEHRVRRALGAVGFDAVKFNRDRVVLARAGMSLTLNGVAQGYITDRIVDLLRARGVTSSLVDMGEDRAIGAKPDGSPWRIGLAERQDEPFPEVVLEVIDKAVATSSGNRFHFDKARRFGHILDPRSGEASTSYRRLTVVANDATTADGLSTAFSLMDEPTVRSILKNRSDLQVDFVTDGGDHRRIGG